MADRSELLQRRSADSLRGRIRRNQIIFFFQFDQSAKEMVVLGIANERVIEDIIVTVVLFNLLTEAKDFFFYLFSYKILNFL